MMKENPLLELETLGQSIWMDFIRRGMISSGQLKQLIEEDGLGGVTSNPSIFEKAIAGSHDYDDAIRALALEDSDRDESRSAVLEAIKLAPVYTALIARGVDVGEMMAEIYGRKTGSCHGKGGSMHIADLSKGMLGANGISIEYHVMRHLGGRPGRYRRVVIDNV